MIGYAVFVFIRRAGHKPFTDMIQAIPVAAFSDNYIWLIPVPGKTSPGRIIIVDPGDAHPVLSRLQALGLEPAAILITHHHYDHTGGIRELISRYRIPVYGPAASPARGIDHPLREGDRITIGDSLEFGIIEVPGHTLDHIAYSGNGILLCGDTLFAGGCGRLFEGSPRQMHDSLRKLAALPRDTLVYCGHEYTLANLAFALALEPDSQTLKARLGRVTHLRTAGRPSLPSTMGEEQDTNPFLRCAQGQIIAAATRHSGHPPRDEVETFAVIRRWKDGFRTPDTI